MYAQHEKNIDTQTKKKGLTTIKNLCRDHHTHDRKQFHAHTEKKYRFAQLIDLTCSSSTVQRF